MKVSLTESAVGDLQELRKYYEEQGVPKVGQQFVTEIIDRIETLTTHPDIGRVVPEFSTDSIRELIHPPFRVVYFREKRSIVIVSVWRSERLLELP